jgi:hypothetical protein
MTLDEQLLQQIVSQVIERLESPQEMVRASDGAPIASPWPRTQDAAASGGLLLTDSVITAKLLEEKVNGAAEVQFSPRSILTPSARDYLHQRAIRWRRATGQPTAGANRSVWKAIIVQSGAAVAAALDDASKSGAVEWRRQTAGDSIEAAELATSALCRGEAVGVVVLAGQPHSLVCRANRNRHVRAAVVASSRCVQAARQQLGANLFCIDPEGKSQFELRNLLRDAAADAAPQPPPGWKEL